MTKTKKLPEFITLPGLGQLALSGARPLIGILLGLLAGAVLIALSGANPLDAYAAMLKGAIGSPQAIGNVLGGSDKVRWGASPAGRCDRLGMAGHKLVS